MLLLGSWSLLLLCTEGLMLLLGSWSLLQLCTEGLMLLGSWSLLLLCTEGILLLCTEGPLVLCTEGLWLLSAKGLWLLGSGSFRCRLMGSGALCNAGLLTVFVQIKKGSQIYVGFLLIYVFNTIF